MTRREPPDDRDTLVDARRTRLGIGGGKEPPAADLTGTMVGGYLVGEHIGSGAMGVVYRGSHIDTNRVVALKAVHAHLLDEPALVERLRREAALVTRLGHPHIGGVIELARADDGRYVLVLELVDGEPLSSIMTMPLDAERVISLVGQLLRGLEHAHAQGLIHRDLKPDNVLVEWRNGRDHARIIDFGIAILRDPDDGSLERLTQTGQMIGTPLYMAPEQAKGEPIDHRADLYSLGVIMYEMLSGVLPFDGRPLDVLAAALKRDPPPISARVPHLILAEPLLERFCQKLMARDLSRRFSSARHALDVLRLVQTDREAARPALGIMDVERALAVVSLPPPPRSKR